MAVSDVQIGKVLQTVVTVTISPAAGAAGVAVALASSNAAVTLGPTGGPSIHATIPAGQNQITFAIQGLAASGAATLSATAPGYTNATGTATLTPSGFVLAGPNGVGTSFPTVTSVTTNLTIFSARLTRPAITLKSRR